MHIQPPISDFLPKPTANSLAEQSRQMGLSAGDVIHGHDRVGCEDRLTLLWLGETQAVFSVQRRNSGDIEWSAPCESSAWTLHARAWTKVP